MIPTEYHQHLRHKLEEEDNLLLWNMKNKRLEAMLRVAASSNLRGGVYLLDCFMGRKIREDISHAITTRTPTDNNTFVLEVYETETDRRQTP